MTFGEEDRLREGAAAEKAAKSDRYLVRRQAELVIEQLRDEGREIAADIVEGLDTEVAQLMRDLEEVREELAELKAGTKSSRGKERASASGTVRNTSALAAAAGRGIAPPHKHEYDSLGGCIKVISGKKCEARRQRQRKPKQAVIPGTDGAGASAGAVP
jgi:hypothetical protein